MAMLLYSESKWLRLEVWDRMYTLLKWGQASCITSRKRGDVARDLIDVNTKRP